MSPYLIDVIHARHLQRREVELDFFDPTCLRCIEEREKRPEWVKRLRLIAHEFSTRGTVA